MKRLSIISLVLMLCVHASAEMPKHDPPDPRLDKKVTLEVKHTKLEEVAKSLTEQSGVTIKAGSGQRDWKVRERTVTVCAKDLPLGKALDQISRTLSFYVSREGKQGEWTYIIWQDKKSRDLEAEMITAQKEASAQHAKDMRQATIDAAADALKMSPDEALKLRDKDPWTAFLGGTKTGRGFAGLLSSLQSQFPTEYDLMMRGKRTAFDLSRLPAGMQKYANDAVAGGMAGQFRDKMGDAAKGAVPSVLAVIPADFMGGNDNAGLLGLSGLMYIGGLKPGEKWNPSNPYGGLPMTFCPLMAPNSLGGRAFGELLFDLEDGTPMEEAGKKIEAKFGSEAMMAQLLARESPTEKEPPTDPKLTREVEINADALPKINAFRTNSGTAVHEAQAKALMEISRAIGMPVMLESFANMMPVSTQLKSGKQPVYQIMISLEKADYSWELQDDALRIRPKDWALRRSCLIPESYVAYYKDLLNKQEMLTLDDLAAIANSLTDDQIQHSLLTDPDLMFLTASLGGSMAGSSRDMFRFYGSLTAAQKESLQSETGLPFGQLSDAQWEQLNKVITDHYGGLYVLDGTVKMIPPSAEQEKLRTLGYTFKVSIAVSGEEKPREMTQNIAVPGKEYIEQMRNIRKAAEQKSGDTSEKQPQPEPAK